MYFAGKASPDSSNPDYVPSLNMGYIGSDNLTPDGKKARFARLKKCGCQKEELRKEKEQQAEAASTLMNLSVSSVPSMSSLPSQPDVDMELSSGQDIGCLNTGKDSWIILYSITVNV